MPRPIRDQLQADWQCDPRSGAIVSTAPGEQTWNVDACGRSLTLRCPVLADGALGRCEYGPAPTGGGAAPIAPTETPVEATTTTTAGTTAYPDDPDAEVRMGIDRRAAGILACTGGAVTAVDLSWTIDGDLHVELTGSLAGTEAEACAQRALTGLPIPSGEAGRIRHPVRAP